MANGSRSSSGNEIPGWLRVVMPSGADLFFLGILGVLACTPLAVRLLGDAGIGWHIRTGQLIWATYSVPRVDSFSSTMSGHPWFAWEWMYDLLVGFLATRLGLDGVVWLTAVTIATVFAGLFSLLIRRGTHLLVAMTLVLLAVAASMIHFLARPHVFTWLFTLAFFWILDSSEREGYSEPREAGHALWLYPLLMLVWVNLHGGFLIGFVLLGIFLLGAAWTWFRSKKMRIEELAENLAARRQVRTLAGVFLLSLAASVANPYGWKLHIHIYRYLSNRFLMDHIDEFRSPNFHGIAQKCFLILLLVTSAVVMVRGRALRMSHALTVLFAVYAGLYASRNIPVSSILLVLVVGPLVPEAGRAQSFFGRMSTIEVCLRGHVWPVLAALLTLVIAVNGGRLGSTVWMDAHFDSKRMPVAAANYLESHHLQESVLSVDYWGGYLIYRFYPQGRVVLDDRHDLYGEEFFKSYLRMVQVEREWQDVLLAHPASSVLLPRDVGLASMLTATRDWKPVYADDVAIVFVRNGGDLHPAKHAQ